MNPIFVVSIDRFSPGAIFIETYDRKRDQMAFLVTKGVKNQTSITKSKWFQIESLHHEGQNLKSFRL